MAKPRIKVVFDGERVAIRGNTADVHVEVEVVAPRVPVVSNIIKKPWYERWWGILLLTVAAGLAVAGWVYLFGWTGSPADKR